MPTSDLLPKDDIEIKEDVQRAFRQALDILAACVRTGNSEATY
ncbi:MULTISPECIES: hypothetical protein [unclassified Streptomyces]|nr:MULTISPECIES: hypothetical protein [unclassified Streptomyces]